MSRVSTAQDNAHPTFTHVIGEKRAAEVIQALVDALKEGIEAAMAVYAEFGDSDAWTWGTTRWRFCLHALSRAINELPGARAPEPKASWYADLGSALLYFYCFGKGRAAEIPEITLQPSELRHQLLNLGFPGQLSLWGEEDKSDRRPSMLCAFAADPRDGLVDLHIGEVHVDSQGHVTWLSHELIDIGVIEPLVLPEVEQATPFFARLPEPTIVVRPRPLPAT